MENILLLMSGIFVRCTSPLVLACIRSDLRIKYEQGIISLANYYMVTFIISLLCSLLLVLSIVGIYIVVSEFYRKWKKNKSIKEERWDNEFHKRYFELYTKGVNSKYSINESYKGNEKVIEDVFELKDKYNKSIYLVRTTSVYKTLNSVDITYEFYQNGVLKHKIESTIHIDTLLFNKSNFKIFTNTKLQNDLKSILRSWECRLKGMRR